MEKTAESGDAPVVEGCQPEEEEEDGGLSPWRIPGEDAKTVHPVKSSHCLCSMLLMSTLLQTELLNLLLVRG